MNKKIFLFLALSAAIFPVFGQNSGIAVEDSGFAPRVNPSALAADNAKGIAYYQEFEEGEGLTDNYALYFNPGKFSYGLESLADDFYHSLALGLKGGEGIYYGASMRWEDGHFSDSEFGLSALIRPYPFFSLGIKKTDITKQSSDLILGAGIRPLAASEYWISRLTFYADTELSDPYPFLATGVSIEPVDGLKLSGDFNHADDALSAGITFSSVFLSSSVNSRLTGSESFGKGSFSLFASGKRMRSLMPLPGKVMVEYDRAGVIRDFPKEGFSIRRIFPDNRKNEISLLEFLGDMEKIRKDPDIDAVFFRDQLFLTSFANITEISRSLSDLKASGKKIYFYFESVSTMQYALAASVADEIYVAPQGTVNLKGFSRTGIYLRDFFARFGIRFYNFRSHEFKTAFNTFTESGMTEGEREALESLYFSLQDELERMISFGRGKKLTAGIGELIKNGPYLSSEKALSAGLIDGKLYNDEISKWARGNDYNVSRYSAFPKLASYDWEYSVKPTVAVIYVTGNIVTGEGITGENAGSDSIAGAIKSARENPLIRGIILRINSGGGSALASDIIAREVALCKEGDNPKPVVVSMGGAAASGGYYIAAPAARIFADPVTITGSIGVIAIFPDISGLLEKLDIKSETVKRSESGDFGNFTRPMTEDEIEKIRSFIEESYGQFVNVVSKGRGISREMVDKSGRGRVWTGSQAAERGLVDSKGGLTDAVLYLEDNYFRGKKARLIELVPGRSIFSISDFMGKAAGRNGETSPEAVKALFDFLKKTDYYKQGEPLFLMPYTVEELGLEG